ncbi:MAG: C45 family autoproteolytic acyltransferase/hydrolase [Jatrophihabitantaceae bacterium]
MSLSYVHACGEPYQLGYQHGAGRRAALQAFLADGLCRLEQLVSKPVSMRSLAPVLAAYDEQISLASPQLARELDGLADGARISRDEALLMQLRREITGYQRIPTMGDCTTYARCGSRPVLAQTIDLNGNLDDQITIVEVSPAASPRRSLILSFGGLLGYLGLNSDGLAIGLNLVLGGNWRPGLPPYLAIRHLLDCASSVDEAITLLGRLPLSSSRSLTLCDSTKVVCVEILDNELATFEGPALAHTNHFLAAGLAERDELNVFARNSSKLRLEAARAGLTQLAADADVERHFELLSAPPICVPDNGDIRREHTVAAVVMLPDRGELHIRPGDPSRHATESFRLAQQGTS